MGLMALALALAQGSAAAQTPTIAQWTYTYAHSGNTEDDIVYRDGDVLHYVQSGQGLRFERTMPIDNIRDASIWEANEEIDVQLWAPFNTSVLVLHFTPEQRELAQQVAGRIERLRY